MAQYTPQDIIDLAYTALYGNTAAGTNVEKSRMDSINTEDLPAISIYVTGSDDAATSSILDGRMRRTDTLAIDARVRAVAGSTVAQSASELADDVKRRLVHISEFRTDFERFENLRTAYRLDATAEYEHAVAEINVDLVHIYQYEPLTTEGDALTSVRTTTDIDGAGSAPDTEVKTDLTGGTP